MSAPNWSTIPIEKFHTESNTLNIFFSHNNPELTHYLSGSGYFVPDLTEDQINNLDANSTKNCLIVDSTNNVIKINLNGTFI